MLSAGSVSLTAVRLLAPHLTPANHREVLESARGKRKAEVEVIIAGRRRLMRARTASPQEKAELWPRVLAANPGYGGYQRKTQREIPLIICEPR